MKFFCSCLILFRLTSRKWRIKRQIYLKENDSSDPSTIKVTQESVIFFVKDDSEKTKTYLIICTIMHLISNLTIVYYVTLC
ncbi:hypothetical protein AQUCO_00100828v1 [Aquilegia coerulea]|uniref:Uncharacterized protein n=1 Tax=Aquilegia coerulea TaxID=218851 RepID=A0A2G5FCD3_AQUCA|nr:hypothetical protein AQUCO_00100828v1 [Aquilegia coerulea]